MKFGQLIKGNIQNFSLEKLRTKCGGETVSRSFSENSNLSISLDQWYKVLHYSFLLYAKSRVIKIY